MIPKHENTPGQYLQSEYEKLRDEIVARNNYTVQTAQFTLTAFAAISAIAYADHGIREIILSYPILAVFFCYLIYVKQNSNIQNR